MPRRGKLIALEGIDGSGKNTQMRLLSQALSKRRVSHSCIGFPHYEGFFGKLVAQYLNGRFGQLADVDPHFSALLYAGDRFESKPRIERDLAAGKLVLADRYIGSNLAHQAARMAPAKRKDFIRWLKELEYGVYGLPVEDLVILLRVPVRDARRLVAKKKARQYTSRRRDLQEANIEHLRQTSQMYDALAAQRNWVRIDCVADGGSDLFTPEEVHRNLMQVVESRILA
jgi:dTMP kinase